MNLEPADLGVFMRLMDIEQLRTLLQFEIRAREEEGFEIAAIRETFHQQNTKTQLIDLYIELLNAPRAKEFNFFEPDRLLDIRRARPDGPRAVVQNLDTATLYDHVYGGWLGRVAGCVLGKPVEPWGPKVLIVEYLSLANSYPLSNYIPRQIPFPDGFYLNPHANGTFLGEIDGAPDDDDTDYTILALHVLESYGLDFLTSDVAAEWLSHLAYNRTFTAERTVYRNLILGVPPTEAARVLNPEREYIGARIRVDVYGLALPGNPELAAELAFRDAVLSHTKNGVYSAMFMAACIAWAFVTNDVEEIVWVGLSEIPADCRLAAAIRDVLEVHQEIDDWEIAYDRLLPKNASYHPVHAINNTVWVVLAMLYGEGDFEKTICTATLCGFDTDCNAATAGTVLGILTGAHALPGKWTDPLKDTLRASVAQFGQTHISDLARRTAALAKDFSAVASNTASSNSRS